MTRAQATLGTRICGVRGFGVPMRNDAELERIRLGLAAIDGELPKLRAIAAPVVAEELDVPRRNGPAGTTGREEAPSERFNALCVRNGGAGSPSVRRDGRPRPLSSRVDESESERAFGGVALALLLGSLCCGAVLALYWLSRQPGEVIGRLVALGWVVLGSAVIAYALARMEQR